MKEKFAKIVAVILCIFVGVLFSYLVMGSAKVGVSQSKITTPKVINDYKKEIENIEMKNKELKDKYGELEEKLNHYKEDKEIDYQSIENELYNELTKYDIISGKLEIQGPGIEIIMMDSDKAIVENENLNSYIIHDGDVLQMINELKFAGAEMIALNGHQLSWDTNIKCAGPVIYIDDFREGTPFVIEAIGDVERIMATLESPDSYLEILRFRTINVSINEKENIVLKKN